MKSSNDRRAVQRWRRRVADQACTYSRSTQAHDGALHGGVLVSIADVALGYGLATSPQPPTSMVTASLSVDFAGSARIGD